MSADELEICSPIIELKAGQLLDITIPFISLRVRVPPRRMVLLSPFCIVANKVFDILMSLGDEWAREYYEETE